MNEIKIKELREKYNLTQAALAQIMGVSVQTIKNWESGKVIPSTSLAKLRQIFNIDNAEGTNVATNINGGSNVQNSTIVLEKLALQLDEKDKQINEKDKQIDRLLTIIEKLS